MDLSVTLFAVLGSASAFKLALYIYCRALRRNPIMVREGRHRARPRTEVGERVWPRKGQRPRRGMGTVACRQRTRSVSGRRGGGGSGTGCVHAGASQPWMWMDAGAAEGACTAVLGARRGSMQQPGGSRLTYGKLSVYGKLVCA